MGSNGILLAIVVALCWGFVVSDSTCILRTCDLLAAARHGHAIERGPGRYGIPNAFFLHVRDPDRHRLEFYTGYYFNGNSDFEPIRWSINDSRRATFWGHVAPPSWFEEALLVTGLEKGEMVATRPGSCPNVPRPSFE